MIIAHSCILSYLDIFQISRSTSPPYLVQQLTEAFLAAHTCPVHTTCLEEHIGASLVHVSN